MRVWGTGLSGLVGSRLVELLSPEFSFEDASYETGTDITNHELVRRRLLKSDASWVFHLAAYTDVDGAEKERRLGEKSTPWIVNVLATDNIARVCRQTGQRLLYISTDYVFDGKKEVYSEKDPPNPQGWYAITKYEGEKRVQSQLGDQALIIRIANPYRAKPVGKKDFVHKILERLAAGQPVSAPDDQIFVPTFIDDIALAIKVLVTNQTGGLYHVVGSDSTTPFAAARLVATTFGYDPTLVNQVAFATFFQGRAPRPKRVELKNDKIKKLGISMRTFSKGLLEVRRQELN